MARHYPKPPPHFLVIIPGYMGSRLRSRTTGELVWLDIPRLFNDPMRLPDMLVNLFKQLKYPNDDLVPDGIMDEVIFLPPLFKQEQYGRLLEALFSWNYSIPGKDFDQEQSPVYVFSYDWRQDNRISARQLAQAIQIWNSRHPGSRAWIIAHSNGGIVARWYIEKEGGTEHVERLFLIASPWDGAPKAFQVLQDGVELFLFRFLNQFGVQELIRQTILTFPSYFQLIPSHIPFLRDRQSRKFDPFHDVRWLQNSQQQLLLLEGQAFNHLLGVTLGVETLCFFGVKQLTTSSGVVEFDHGGKIKHITWERSEDGDGTIPVHSALHLQAAQKLPFLASHGDIYVNPGLLAKLKYELIDRYRYGAYTAVLPDQIKAQFELDKNVYEPGQQIQINITLTHQETGLPVIHAQVVAKLIWRQALPLAASHLPESLPVTTCREVSQFPGLYIGGLIAPDIPGIYKLVVQVSPPRHPKINLEELILIEGENSYPR